MSNLFRRLVTDQLSPQPVRVRPTASLPYQAPPVFSEDIDDSAGADGFPPPAPSTTQAPTAPQHTTTPIAPRATDRPEPAPSAAEPRLPTPLTDAHAHAVATEHAARTGKIPAERAATENQDTNVRAARTARVAFEPPQPIVDARAAETEAPPPRTPTEDFTDATQTEPAHTRGPEHTAEAMPARLLPPHTPPRRQPATANPPERTDTSSTPNEVHVHIGRIEVTAVQESPQPKPRQKRGQAPLSLDDYLAKRRGGST